MAASEFAVKASGIEVGKVDPERLGVYIGSGIGGFEVIEREHKILLERGPSRMSPFFIPSCIVNLASGYVSIRYCAKGPNSATATACTTSAHSLGDSFRLIQYGDADMMIAGGSEACVTPMGVGGFAAMRALSTRNDAPEKASRPWDKHRDGFVVGEGSGILILEELEHAKRRGANILAEIVGYGMSADAHHITAPPEDGNGGFRVMRNALRDAGLEPSQIDYINAHGTSTGLGDRAETEAIKSAFGEHAYKLTVSSTKSMTGHVLGGAGGLEAGITVLAIRDQIAPPTINLEEPGEGCDLDYAPNQARKMKIDYALSNSFGFGGTNGCLIFKKFAG
jgi:3-oxoacyl-[acyl-carrier-protein] synthase II